MPSREALLEYHLGYNHYPPVHPAFIPVASAAIDHASECEDSDCGTQLDTPNGNIGAHQVMDELHLHPFVGWQDEDEDD